TKTPPIFAANPLGDVEQQLRNFYQQTGNRNRKRPQLIVCVLPNTGISLYAEIKRVSDTVLGVSTQCVQVKHTRLPKKQMNVKLGGDNSFIHPKEIPFLSEKPTIIMGADVTHPTGGDAGGRPSIASLVGSMDAQGARYASAVRVQGSRVESIEDMGGMCKEILRAFYQSTGRKPARILFYRDGVSEGQFATVLEKEVRLEPGYRPTITWVVVQKRHHTTFFPVSKQQADRSGNCPAGTLVETDITHPTEFDFYVSLDLRRELNKKKWRNNPGLALTFSPFPFPPSGCYLDIMCERARFHAKSESWSDAASSIESDDAATGALSYAKVMPELQNVMYCE
ncbi:MAG: Piwi domain-containing protein, partial [Olpidium bornovanus]